MVQQQFLNKEETVIKRLKGVYGQSLKDITGKISDLDKSIGALQKALADVDDDEIGDLAKAFLGRRANISPAEAKETLQSMLQSKVYQKRYQEALKGQIDGIMDKMHSKEYKIVSDYLKECYEDGFIGTMFDLQGQGIPLCFPLDQEAMVRAVQLDSKISQGLYARLGEDVALLKKKITAQVSRGIATGMSYQQVARGLSAYTNIGYNNAVRIARTEGHRIQVQGTMDACYKAKEKGADVVKQWDSTLDGRTRESHAQVDGEIRELDKPFSNGLMFPGDPSGGAAEVVNCRCALLQRARWALDDGFTKMNNFTKELEEFKSPQEYEKFKEGFFSPENKKYMNYVQQMEEKYKTKDFSKVLDSMTDREYKHYSKLLASNPMFNAKATSDPYGNLSFMQKKELIYTNEQKIDRLRSEKKQAELEGIMASSTDEMGAAFAKAKDIQGQIDGILAENDSLQKALGLPTNAKERFYSQNIDVRTLPHDISAEEYDALSSWSRTGYLDINRYMRYGDKGVRPQSISDAKTIEKCLDRNIVQEPFTVKRGINRNAMDSWFGGDSWRKEGFNPNGAVIVDKGFCATSHAIHGGFGGDVVAFIDVPAGAKGAYIADISGAKDEEEFLLQCGTFFRFDRVEITYDKWNEPHYDVYLKVIVDG